MVSFRRLAYALRIQNQTCATVCSSRVTSFFFNFKLCEAWCLTLIYSRLRCSQTITHCKIVQIRLSILKRFQREFRIHFGPVQQFKCFDWENPFSVCVAVRAVRRCWWWKINNPPPPSIDSKNRKTNLQSDTSRVGDRDGRSVACLPARKSHWK